MGFSQQMQYQFRGPGGCCNLGKRERGGERWRLLKQYVMVIYIYICFRLHSLTFSIIVNYFLQELLKVDELLNLLNQNSFGPAETRKIFGSSNLSYILQFISQYTFGIYKTGS